MVRKVAEDLEVLDSPIDVIIANAGIVRPLRAW